MSFSVIGSGDHEWVERPAPEGTEPRLVSDLTTSAGLVESRARLWRLPAHVRGRRHIEGAQEEVFVVLEGTLTMLLGNGDAPERHDLPPESIVTVATGTGLQMRNETDEEVVVFVYGAPPVTGQASYLDDIETL